MSHKLKDCELNHAGECIFCGRKQDKRKWLLSKGLKLYSTKPTNKENK